MIDLIQMKTFILVIEHGSLVGAAKCLQISSAAVSQQMTRLEKSMGLQLLIRTTRKIELTEVGQNYYDQCKRVLREVEATENLASELKAEPSGKLKVALNRHFAARYILPRLKEFLNNYPKIALELEIIEKIPDLEKDSIDVLIGMSLPPVGDVIQKKIATTRYCYLASASYIKESGCPAHREDLANHHYIAHSRRLNIENPVNDEFMNFHSLIKVNDIETLMALCKQGLGIAKVQYFAAEELIHKGQLIEVLKDIKQESIPLYVAFPARRFIPSKTRVFIDFFCNGMT